ncbi:MAG: SDR family oxidoreductase [Salinibacterium sp.]|nr:SDR family oxidoreductase [Salinibacterium sp.]
MTTPPVTTGRLSGKRVIVTGGARGLGGEIATRFAGEGARVSILDRLVERGQARAEEIDGEFFEVDLLDPIATAGATQSAIDRMGGVDVLVNSAGILNFTPLLDLTVEDWDETFAINTRAMLTTMQVSVRWMLDHEVHGKIINLASMAAKQGGVDEGAYPASKAAVVALTRQAALEWGCHGITVNSLCPGYILTELAAGNRTDEDVVTWISHSPLGRLGTPEDVASVALFLATSDSDYLTGQAINVTGGMITH